jgi:proline dehydrogenase
VSLARSALLRASRSRWLAEQMMRREFARRAVKKFMPGEQVSDALDACNVLATEGLGGVITQLGENLTTLGEARKVRDHYLGVLADIESRRLSAVISVKPTQLGLDLSAAECLAYTEALAAKAESFGKMLWVDMEDSSYVDRTLDLYRRLKEKHANVGLCIQSYLRRTPADLESLLPIKPAIRLVKGAYAEQPHVAFPEKRDVDLAYYALAETLLSAAAKGSAFPVFGTHDRGLIERIAARAAALAVPNGKWEVHMLYGIRSGDQRELVRRGHTVRCLISYGSAWFAWYMRRLAERPANVWFVVKSMVG